MARTRKNHSFTHCLLLVNIMNPPQPSFGDIWFSDYRDQKWRKSREHRVFLKVMGFPSLHLRIWKTHTHTHTNPYTHTHIHTHTQTLHTHTHTDPYTHTYTHSHTNPYTHTYIHTHTHTDPYTHTYTHSHTHKPYTHTYTHSHTNPYTHTHAYIYTLIHTHKPLHTHTHMHTYTLIHTHWPLTESNRSYNLKFHQGLDKEREWMERETSHNIELHRRSGIYTGKWWAHCSHTSDHLRETRNLEFL